MALGVQSRYSRRLAFHTGTITASHNYSRAGTYRCCRPPYIQAATIGFAYDRRPPSPTPPSRWCSSSSSRHGAFGRAIAHLAATEVRHAAAERSIRRHQSPSPVQPRPRQRQIRHGHRPGHAGYRRFPRPPGSVSATLPSAFMNCSPKLSPDLGHGGALLPGACCLRIAAVVVAPGSLGQQVTRPQCPDRRAWR